MSKFDPANELRYAREFNYKLSELGLTNPPTNSKTPPKNLFEKRYNDLSTPVKDLYEEFNLTSGAFNRIRRRYGIPPRRPIIEDTQELTTKLVITYLQEHSTTAVSEKTKIDSHRVADTLRNSGFIIPKNYLVTKLVKHL